jgi:hypothetical protein
MSITRPQQEQAELDEIEKLLDDEEQQITTLENQLRTNKTENGNSNAISPVNMSSTRIVQNCSSSSAASSSINNSSATNIQLSKSLQSRLSNGKSKQQHKNEEIVVELSDDDSYSDKTKRKHHHKKKSKKKHHKSHTSRSRSPHTRKSNDKVVTID